MTGHRSKNCLSSVDVAILAGGLGTRIRPVLGDIPKVLAPINGATYLDHLLRHLYDNGARRVVMCLGHLADKVTDHLACHCPPNGMTVDLVIEPTPLGTAGALRLADQSFRTDPVMVMNGDTWIETDWCAFIAAHAESGADTSILCVEVDDVSRYGQVQMNDGGRIEKFVEKSDCGTIAGTISGGVYLFSTSALRDLKSGDGPSLEVDFLQKCAPGSLYGYVSNGGVFIDIGTPESLTTADSLIN